MGSKTARLDHNIHVSRDRTFDLLKLNCLSFKRNRRDIEHSRKPGSIRPEPYRRGQPVPLLLGADYSELVIPYYIRQRMNISRRWRGQDGGPCVGFIRRRFRRLYIFETCWVCHFYKLLGRRSRGPTANGPSGTSDKCVLLLISATHNDSTNSH